MDNIERIKTELINLEVDAKKFYDKNNDAAGTRARKTAMEIIKHCKQIRADIQDDRADKK